VPPSLEPGTAPNTITINGSPLPLQGPPTQTLLHWLRQQGLVGTKEGCGDGDCGACTVVILGQDSSGQPQYQAVNSCLMPIGVLAGREIVTVEGVANGSLHPVQQAMVDLGGSQCGYCTPGFIMSLFAAHYNGELGEDDVLDGNLCRCTGYLPIRRAAQQVAAQPPAPEDPFTRNLAQPLPPLAPSAHPSEDQQCFRPAALADVVALVQQHPTATLVAGSTDLGLEMSWHRQHYPVLIALEAVAELTQIEVTPTAVTIGAAVPLSRIEHDLRGQFPCLDEMLYWFAARQVRNRATLGGNLGTASPIGDLLPVLLALDATLELVSAAGSRTLAVAEFFLGYRATALQAGEVIRAVTLPTALAPGAVRRLSQAYKVGKRGTDDISIVAAVYRIDLDGQDRIVTARLAYGGVAATPARATAVEEWLVGRPWNAATVAQAQAQLADAFTPLSDLRGSAAYRQRLIQTLWAKFFAEFGAAPASPDAPDTPQEM